VRAGDARHHGGCSTVSAGVCAVVVGENSLVVATAVATHPRSPRTRSRRRGPL